jgi:uncharacterized pyridoxamine 5'-phosphate oxidase family protein
MEHKGKLYFGMGTHKDVWKQTLANSQVEICALKPNPDQDWVRIYGKAVVDSDPETLSKALEKMPHLKTIYNEQTGLKMGLVWIDEGKVDFMSMKGKTETISF